MTDVAVPSLPQQEWCGACWFNHDPALGCVEAAQAAAGKITKNAKENGRVAPSGHKP